MTASELGIILGAIALPIVTLVGYLLTRRGASESEKIEERRVDIEGLQAAVESMQKALAAADVRIARQAEQVAQQAERQTATDVEVAKLRAERDVDATYIEALIAHIWAGKKPPPPARPTI